MNGQSYYQYQMAAQGNPGLMVPQTYLASPGTVMAGQTVLMSPAGYTIVPPPPPPAVGGAAAINPTPDYAGSTISAPASLYSQTTSSNSETTQSQNTQATATTTQQQSVVTTSISSPQTTEVVKETKAVSPASSVEVAAANYAAQMNSASSSSASTMSMTQQSSIHAIQQQQALELQQALAARTAMPGYGVQKAVQPQMQFYNPYAAQPTIAMDAYGRQYVLQHAPAQQPKVASYPMVGGQGLVHPSYMSGAAAAPTKLHTTTTLELPSQQQALQNLYLPNAMAQQQAVAGLQGYYNPAAAAAVSPQAAGLQAGTAMPRQQLVQYNGQTYLTYMPQTQVVQRKY